jgi:hypothetical protein
MRAIAETYTPQIRGWAARLHGRRMLCMKLHGSSGMMRRFAWARTLMARFAHLPLPDLGRGRHFLLHGSWQWIRSSSSFAPQLQFALHTSVNANWNQHEPFRGTPPGLAMSGHGTMLHTVLARDHYRQHATLLNTVLFLQSTQRHWHQEIHRSLATVIMKGSTARAAVSGLPTGAAATTQKRADASETPWSLATRVLRQNQRIEEIVSGRPQTVLLRPAGSPLRERAFMDSPAVPQMRTSAPSLEWPSPEPRPGVNISHITDEVVRQLDSRLVAARERFGKI